MAKNKKRNRGRRRDQEALQYRDQSPYFVPPFSEKVLDPTLNVMDALRGAVARQDDLRDSEMRRLAELIVMRSDHNREIANLRSNHNSEILAAETRRIDALRAVDVGAISVANERAVQQAAVLATQVATSAEALRGVIATTAATTQTQLTNLANQLSDRLSTVERAQYESKGQKGGTREVWGWIFSAILAVGSIAGLIYTNLRAGN